VSDVGQATDDPEQSAQADNPATSTGCFAACEPAGANAASADAIGDTSFCAEHDATADAIGNTSCADDDATAGAKHVDSAASATNSPTAGGTARRRS
jgi:hypothetical protein